MFWGNPVGRLPKAECSAGMMHKGIGCMQYGQDCPQWNTHCKCTTVPSSSSNQSLTSELQRNTLDQRWSRVRAGMCIIRSRPQQSWAGIHWVLSMVNIDWNAEYSEYLAWWIHWVLNTEHGVVLSMVNTISTEYGEYIEYWLSGTNTLSTEYGVGLVMVNTLITEYGNIHHTQFSIIRNIQYYSLFSTQCIHQPQYSMYSVYLLLSRTQYSVFNVSNWDAEYSD